MEHHKRPAGPRWLLLTALVFASLVITGCEKGSLGVKEGSIRGYVLDVNKNTPVADVYVTATKSDGVVRDAMTGGDGAYSITVPSTDPTADNKWTLKAEKFGYIASGSADGSDAPTVVVGNGETSNAPVMRLIKTYDTTKGILKGYPIDAVTGVPLQNLTVTQIAPARFKTFDTAQEFKANGWSGLEGGGRQYKITCENYSDYFTAPTDGSTSAGDTGPLVTITGSPYDLGVIKMNPLSVSISGTLRNLPGYVIDAWGQTAKPVIWAEAAGKIVATATAIDAAGADAGATAIGNVVYQINGVPITAGSVAIKCKIRGYDVVTINPSVSLPKQRPGGIIGSIDANFANVEPIKRDVRVIVHGTAPDDTADPPKPSSVGEGETIRVFIKQGGKDIVPYVDVVGHNSYVEAYFSGVITGYEIKFMALNMDRGYIFKTSDAETIMENGNSIYTVEMSLTEGS